MIGVQSLDLFLDLIGPVFIEPVSIGPVFIGPHWTSFSLDPLWARFFIHVIKLQSLDPFWAHFWTTLDRISPTLSIQYLVMLDFYDDSNYSCYSTKAGFHKVLVGFVRIMIFWKLGQSNLGVCELIFDFKKIFSYTNCTELNIQFLKSINEESKRTEDELDKIMSSGMVLVNNILNGSDESVSQQRAAPIDGRFGLNSGP